MSALGLDLDLGLDLLFDAGDLESLQVNGAAVTEEGEEEEQELHRLSRRISGQYVDVVVAFAAQAFAGRPPESARVQVLAALDALSRLANASHDAGLLSVLSQLHELLPRSEQRGRAARSRFLGDMRTWVIEFAALLDAEEAERVRGLVAVDRAHQPLLDALGSVRGIGPKRLERLYCAGLFTVEALTVADPMEVAAVTGLPDELAKEVIHAARRFAEAERERCILELAQRAAELRSVSRALPRNGQDASVIEAARQAILELQQVLSSLERAPQESS